MNYNDMDELSNDIELKEQNYMNSIDCSDIFISFSICNVIKLFQRNNKYKIWDVYCLLVRGRRGSEKNV